MYPSNLYQNYTPFRCHPQEFTDPSLTDYEVEKRRLEAMASEVDLPREAKEILSAVNKYKTAPHHQEWVHICFAKIYY